MADPCKVYSYTNVGTEKDVLANIGAAARAGGWSVDRDAVGDEGELYVHSAGNGNQRLYFSLRLEQAYDAADRYLLSVHGNTGFDASEGWDAQPGRFTEKIQIGRGLSAGTEKPLWCAEPGTRCHGTSGWWIVPPVAEQIVLVCPTFILTSIRVMFTFADGKDTLYSGWVPLFFGAADGDASETELNTVQCSLWGSNNAQGQMFSGLCRIPRNASPAGFFTRDYRTVGLLRGGVNVERLPTASTYGYTGAAPSVVLASVMTWPFIGNAAVYGYVMTGTVTAGGESFGYCYKGNVCASVPCYNAAACQNPGTLRSILVKPLLYVADADTVGLAGELPYYAVAMSGLKPKDRIAVGGRTFMVLPNIADSDAIGLAVEVEA